MKATKEANKLKQAKTKETQPKDNSSRNKLLIAGVFAAIMIVAVGVSYYANTEKNSPGYDTGPLKFFLTSIDKFTISLTLVIGIIILAIAVIAFQKVQSGKFMLIMLAFALFVLEWAIKLIDRWYIPGQLLFDPIENLLELGIIVFLAAGIFLQAKR